MYFTGKPKQLVKVQNWRVGEITEMPNTNSKVWNNYLHSLATDLIRSGAMDAEIKYHIQTEELYTTVVV